MQYQTGENIKLRRINEEVWEIPKEDKMNCPVIVFASEKLLEIVRKDKTLWQAKNISMIPGVLKAFVMSDAHQGYGSPIGGVAAIDKEKGGISPGFVGYDINCLPSDAKILTEFGSFKKIKDFVDNFNENEIETNNLKLKSVSNLQILSLDKTGLIRKPIIYFIEKENDKTLLTIETELGNVIRATSDHPILTKKGMIESGKLKIDDEVAITTFIGSEHENTKSNNDENELARLTRLLGYLLGDGLIYFSNKKAYVNAYGDKETLEEIKKDIECLNYSAYIYKRIREHKILTPYGERNFSSENFELHCSSNELAQKLIQLGMPIGKKTNQNYGVPEWIKKSPKWIQRLFLAGFFGAELSKPRTHTKTGFDCPTISQNKNIEYKDSMREFLIDIMQLLENFEIETNKIFENKYHKNKEGETWRLRLFISSNEDNLLKLWRKIGFEYNKKRKQLAEIACFYILKKKNLTKKRSEIRDKAREYRNKGLKPIEIKKLLISKEANERFIERSIYEDAKERITLDFPSFEEFLNEKSKIITEYGCLFDKIKNIKKEKYEGKVYDFTVEETHNFVADGFIVSNCGVRLLKTNLTKEEVEPKLKQLIDAVYELVPAGLGEGNIKVSQDEFDEVLKKGARWAVENKYGTKEDLEFCEENGEMKTADSTVVSQKAKSRGRSQIGSLGSGNHFAEVQFVDHIGNSKEGKSAAEVFGLKKDQVVFMIHTGSRGLGHQVCSDYLQTMEKEFKEELSKLPDRELVYAPAGTQTAENYFKAMSAAANMAWCNRHVIAHFVRKAFEKVFPDSEVSTLYDVAHNIAKIEKHFIDGHEKTVYMHRKGATRAFPPGNKEIPEKYRKVGQPVLIPGSMGTASYVLVGTQKGMEVSLGTTAHGAGRTMSRHAAIDKFKGEVLVKELGEKGIIIKGHSWKGLAEEAPGAYKDVDEVVKVSDDQHIGKIVARLKPMGVVKG